MQALVSILIPAYNAGATIADAIGSALAQTWPFKEVVVVDDGSKDRTLSIARRCASGEVTVVTQPNKGAAAARNLAYSLCQGNYIQWLDADDLLAPDKIAMQMQALDHCSSNRVLLSSAWGRFMYRYRKAKFSPTLLWRDLSPVEWLLRKMRHSLFMPTSTWLVSRELTEAVGPWNTGLFSDDDGEYFCRVILASDGTRFVPESKTFYRSSGSSRLSYIGRSNRKMEAQFESMKLQIGYFRSAEDSERVRTACLNYLKTWLVFFYPERPDIVEQAEQLAAALGGHLGVPRLRWKYAWLQGVFGYGLAKRAQFSLPELKDFLIRACDKALFYLESHNLPNHLPIQKR